jgi:hypothetical protein
MKYMLYSILLLLAGSLFAADVVVLQEGVRGYDGTRDTALDGNPRNQKTWNINMGGMTMLPCGNRGVGRDPSRDLRRALIKFELPKFSRDTRIISASLELYCFTNGGIPQEASSKIACFAVKKAWGEGGSKEKNAQKGEASWLANEHPTRWEKAGCEGSKDRGAKALSTVDVDTEKGWFAWDITHVAGSWAAGRFANNGLILRQEAEDTRGFRVFYSSEAAEAGLRPKLVITYAGRITGAADGEEVELKESDKLRYTLGTRKDVESGGKSISVVQSVLDENRMRVRATPTGGQIKADQDLIISFRYYVTGAGGKLRLLLSGGRKQYGEMTVTNPRKGSWQTVKVNWNNFRNFENHTKPQKMALRTVNWFLDGANLRTQFFVADVNVQGNAPKATAKPRKVKTKPPKDGQEVPGGVDDLGENEEF